MLNPKSQIQILKLKSKLRSFAIFVVILSFGLFVLSSKVSAQQVSLSISPPLLETIIQPSKSIMVAYRIENTGDPTILKSIVLPFEAKDNFGNIRLKKEFEGPVRFSLDNADLQLEQPFFLKTNDFQQLLLRIRIPEGAPEGDYYYTLLVETSEPKSLDGVGSTRAKAAIGSNILITVTQNGLIEVKPKIVLFNTLEGLKIRQNLKLYDTFDKISLMSIVENRGKNMIKPVGAITLKGNLGEEIKYNIIPKNILSMSQRLIEATPSAEPDRVASLVLSGFFIGIYRLSTTLTFGENSPTIFASTTFLALPFKLIAGLIVVIAVSILIIRRTSPKEDDD